MLFVILYKVELWSEKVREFGSAAALLQKVRGMTSVNDPIIWRRFAEITEPAIFNSGVAKQRVCDVMLAACELSCFVRIGKFSVATRLGFFVCASVSQLIQVPLVGD